MSLKSKGQTLKDLYLRFLQARNVNTKTWRMILKNEKWVRLEDVEQRLSDQAEEHHNCVMQELSQWKDFVDKLIEDLAGEEIPRISLLNRLKHFKKQKLFDDGELKQ